MTPESPLVSVLLPAYNAEKYIDAAVDSILAQSLPDLELLVIDDASRDSTVSRISERRDARIRLLRSTSGNTGVAAALNRGLEAARGRYLARMDADDVAHTDRLRRQLDVLRRNPSVGLIGSAVQPIDGDGRAAGEPWRLPTTSAQLRWHLFMDNQFAHPSVMMTRAAVEAVGDYSTTCPGAEDYDLWLRIASRFDVMNLPEVLVDYRLHPDSITGKAAALGHRSALAAAARAASHALHKEIAPAALDAIRHQSINDGAGGAAPVSAVALLADLYHWWMASVPATQADTRAVRLDVAHTFVRLLRRGPGRLTTTQAALRAHLPVVSIGRDMGRTVALNLKQGVCRHR